MEFLSLIHACTHSHAHAHMHSNTLTHTHTLHSLTPQRSAKVLTVEERREMEETIKAEKNTRLEAANTRKVEMQELEILRKKNEKPSDLEQVSKFNSQRYM